MILRRNRPMHYEQSDPRTLVVIDRLEAVADRIEQLAADMERRLQIEARKEGRDPGS